MSQQAGSTVSTFHHVADEKEGHQRVPAEGQRRGPGRQGAVPALRLGGQREKGLIDQQLKSVGDDEIA